MVWVLGVGTVVPLHAPGTVLPPPRGAFPRVAKPRAPSRRAARALQPPAAGKQERFTTAGTQERLTRF